MRYLESESPYIISRFSTGDTVTIDIYDLSDNSLLVNGASMAEIATTGFFKYLFNPTVSTLKEYLYIAETTTEEHSGKIILGGYPDGIKDNTDNIPASPAPSNEYDTEMGYIPSNLGEVPTAAELISAHGTGAWTPADVSALATTAALSTHDTKLDAVKAKTDTIEWTDITTLVDESGGKWEISGNQMIFYESDNITEIMRFNLFDASGNPAMTNVYKRERVL